MTTKIDLTNIADTALTTLTGPKVTTIVYPGDDTATDTAGGQTINLTGSGFQSGCSVLVGSTAASVVSFISSTQISFTAPVQTAGTYVLYVINPDGGTAISIPGISYSGTPNWTTTAGSLGTAYETGAISATLTATGDAPITYTLVSGTLPTGSSLNSNGTLSGTAVATASATTYSFTIRATDAQNQDTNRAFSITINPDVVTWSAPASSTTYNVFTNSAIANVTMSATSAAGGSITYTADTLPTGLSITGANIAGTPTVAASTTTTLTATATSTRSATRTINWVVTVANDIYFKNTTLLLNGETTVTPFISDASTNSFGLTINGDTKPVLFNPYQGDGYYGAYFNGSSYVDVTVISAPVPSTGQFTVEGWIYTTASATQIIYSQYTSVNSSRWMFLIDNSSGYKLSVAHGTAATVFGSTVVPLNQWNHVALTRDASNVLRIFLNGVLDGSQSSYTSTLQQTDPRIGYYNNSGSVYFNGYISNLRAINGTAQYTASFTPPTTPLTAISGTSFLGFQSNRLIDKSTNGYAIINTGVQISPNIPFTQNSSYSTYGSTYFDGTGDTLYIPSPTTGFSLGGGEFTIEMWVYKPSAVNVVLLDARSSAAGIPWVVAIDASNFPYLYDNTVYASTVAVTLNSWSHVAVVRTSGVLKIFVNGVQGYSASYSANLDRTAGLVIGDTVHAAAPMLGYISNVRIVKGTAVYTSAFTPPTTPLTAIANTQLLTLQYNGGAKNQGIIDNGPFNNIVTRFGNTSQGTFSPYSVTGWSTYFNGSTDYFSISSNTQFAFGTGDFTVEAWIYYTGTLSGALVPIAQSDALGSSTNDKWWFGINDSTLFFNTHSSGGFTSTIAFTPSVGTWYHVAATRASGTMRLFVNGVASTVTITGTPSGYSLSQNGFTIGAMSTPYYMTGYISNFRMIKGTAIYTSSFTPSTTSLTPVTNTTLLTCQSNRIIDNSPNNFALTTAGTPRVQAFGPFGSVPEAVPLSYSNYFDGTGDYLSIATNAAFQLGTNSYTFETWIFPTALGVINTNNIINIGTYITGLMLRVNGTTTGLQVYTNNTERLATSTGLVANTWQHIALVRNGSACTVYINGVVNGTFTDSSSISPTIATVLIGMAAHNSSEFFTGYMSNWRLVKGTALYTSNFTPSTTPLIAIANTSLLTCQSTTMIDNSTNNFAITAFGNTVPRQFNPFGYTAQSTASYTPSLHGGSAYFDGTGDYISTPAINWSTYGSYTFEFWIYHSSFTQGSQAYASTGGTGYTNFYCYGSTGTYPGAVCVGIQGTNEIRTPNNTITGFGWYYITYTYDGTTTNIFVNGIKQTTSVATSTAVYSNNSASFIIGSGLQGAATVGYMSDVRLTKGTPLYTNNFVPPTQKLSNYSTSIPSSLLLNFNNGGIIDQHGSNVLETLGNAQLSTAVKKYNNASIYFDGTGDYLYSPPNLNYAMGSGDFTIELWYYPITHTNTDPALIGNYNVTWTTNKWTLHAPHASYANKYSLWVNNYATGSAILVSTSTMTDGAWVHIAITRSGSTWKMFINGTVEATTTSSVALDGGTAASMDGLYVGANFYSGAGGRHINAYMDDLRITKGYARYTSNFTAPTSALITK